MIISAGTWFLAGTNLAEPVVCDEVFAAGFANEGGYAGIRLLKNIIGSWPAQELCRLWSQKDGKKLSWDLFDEMAMSAPAFACRLDMGDRRFFSPRDMEATIVSSCRETGQAPPDSRAQIARSVYEGIAAEVARTAEQLAGILRKPMDEILMLGGGSRSDILNQWIADASGVPVRTGPVEATALGNALIQTLTLGWIGSLSEGRQMLEHQFEQRVFLARDDGSRCEAARQPKGRKKQV